MAEYRTEPSISELIRGVLDDTRELFREEIALARAELREEISKARTAAVALVVAGVAATIGTVLLCVALGAGLADLFEWPVWTGYGVVALLLLGFAFVLMLVGRTRVASIRALPKTVDSVKENVEWVQKKSASR